MDSNQIELKSREIPVLLQKHLMRGTNMLIAEKERERGERFLSIRFGQDSWENVVSTDGVTLSTSM
jgi:hypothetical protein